MPVARVETRAGAERPGGAESGRDERDGPGDLDRAGRRHRRWHRGALGDARAAPQRARRRALRSRRRGRGHGRQPRRRRGVHVRHRRALHHQPARDRDRRVRLVPRHRALRRDGVARWSQLRLPVGPAASPALHPVGDCREDEAPSRRRGDRGGGVPARLRPGARGRDRAPADRGVVRCAVDGAVARGRRQDPEQHRPDRRPRDRGAPDPPRGGRRLLPRRPRRAPTSGTSTPSTASRPSASSSRARCPTRSG